MCGIAGIIHLDGTPVEDTAIDRFTDSLAHRGPDGRGVWIDDTRSVALGHRRLAILDLSPAGWQPMAYLGGRYRITFNGEIFNFIEIRNELRQLGYEFISDSDTEVIMAAYDRWGSDMLLRLNGMWAFAIYDIPNRALFLARDRFGVKPLHFARFGRSFAFASELKAFRSLDGFPLAISQDSALAILRSPYSLESSERTLLAGVSRLQAGHLAVLKDGELTVRRWWNTLDHLVETPPTLPEQAERFLDLFDDAVRLRMRSDVAVGTCLSGGFDSTAIACTMARLGTSGAVERLPGNWQHAFIATFPGSSNDERPDAERAVAYSGVTGHYIEIDRDQALTNLSRVLDDCDDVYGAVPTAVWLIYRELRRGKVYVTLDGHGADELMGAYENIDSLLLKHAPSLTRHPLRNIEIMRDASRQLREVGLLNPRDGGFMHALSATCKFHPDLTLFRSIESGLRHLSKRALAGRMAHGFLTAAGTQTPAGIVSPAENDQLPTEWGEFLRTLHRQFHTTILPVNLRDFDRLSMAHGIEIRIPFLDWRLVTYVESLPAESKLGGGYSKRIAREAMRGLMPEAIRSNRRKTGFTSPMPRWFAGPMRGWVLDLLSSQHCINHPLVNTARLARVFTERRNPEQWSWRECHIVWPLIHYLWFEQYFLRRS